MPYYLHRKYWIGVNGDLDEALAAEFPGETPPRACDFEQVTAEEYDNAVLDLRYEGDEWQQ